MKSDDKKKPSPDRNDKRSATKGKSTNVTARKPPSTTSITSNQDDVSDGKNDDNGTENEDTQKVNDELSMIEFYSYIAYQLMYLYLFHQNIFLHTFILFDSFSKFSVPY